MTRRTQSLPADYFEGMYADNADPWRFATSDYEREKYAATIAALPKAHYRSAVEIGCSIGVLTRQLAARCDAILGTDVVAAALASARALNGDRPNVRFEQGAVPKDWPEGRFDLVVLSEVTYFLDRPDVARLARKVEGALEPDGDIVLVHWLGLTDFPLSGDEAPEAFIAETAGFTRILRQERTADYRLDVLTRTA